MESEIKLQLIGDIRLFEDSFLGKNKYFIMSDSREKYLKLTKGQYAFYERLVPYLNGNLTLEQVMECFCKDNNIPEEDYFDVAKTIKSALGVLDKHCLFVHNKMDNIPKVEYELAGRKVMHIVFDRFQEKHSVMLKNILKVIMLISIFTILSSIFLLIRRKEFAINNFIEAQNFSWRNLNSVEIVIIIFSVLGSIIFHEFGHILTANYYCVKIKSLTLLLRMGISPVFYVRYANFYATKSKNKIKIMFAGIYFNLILASMLWLVVNIHPDWKCALIMVINFWLFFDNLVPSGPNDGFNILSTIFGIEGLRWSMLVQVGKLINDRKLEKRNILFVLYFLITYGLTFYGIYFLIMYIIGLLNITFYGENIRTAVFVILIIVVLLYTKEFVKSLKRIGK